MCSQAWVPFRGPHPPEGDEVGGDDLALGEDHVSEVQEGERRDRGSSSLALAQAQATFTTPGSQHLLPFLPATQSGPCPVKSWAWCLPARSA